MAEPESPEAAIRRLVANYCAAVGRLDAAAAAALFAPDARVQIHDFPELVGRAAIAEGLAATFAHFAFIHHACDTALIQVAGERASGWLNIFEATHRRDREGLNLVFGTYQDEYRLTREGWRFAQRRFHLRARARLPVVQLECFPPPEGAP